MSNGYERLGEEVGKAFQYVPYYLFGHSASEGSHSAIWNPWVVHLDTLVWTWVGMGILIGFAFYLRAHLVPVPKARSLQNFIEMLWEFFANIARDLLGKDANTYMPIIFTIFCFVLLGNFFGLTPALFVPYTRDINTTVALALFSVLGYNLFSISKKGLAAWVGHFFGPVKELWHSIEGPAKYIMVPFLVVLFLFINTIEHFARLISLSMRLFGNIMGKHIVMAVLISLAAFSVWFLRPIIDAVPLFVWLIGLIASIVQALIFPLLTMAYIAGAIEQHDHNYEM